MRRACELLVVVHLVATLLPGSAFAASRAAVVRAGLAHTCAVTAGGGLKCWGRNWSGQLGDGTSADRIAPTDVSGLTSGVDAVAVGGYHTCALTTGGGVKCWGDNGQGRLGDGTTVPHATPTDVSGLTSGVAAVAAGLYHTCAVTTGGGVKCWGDNSDGQLGDGTTTSRTTPTDVTGLASGVVAVSAGDSFTCALTAGHGVKCWGYNNFGQLGDGTTTDRATPTDVSELASGVAGVATGGSHTCALTTGGGVKCWGANGYAQLGDGSVTTRVTPVDVSGLASGVTEVSSGGFHTCALTATGGVKCWGSNVAGELGDGTSTSRATPTDVSGLTRGAAAVTAGYAHTCAVTAGGGVRCWGDDAAGQLGDGRTTLRTTPIAVTGLATGGAAVAAGFQYTCAVKASGGLVCWGDNGSAQLGDGTTMPRTTPAGTTGLESGVAAVATAYTHTCALTTGGGVKCWGDNNDGQLGDGTRASRITPTPVTGLTSGAVAVAAGEAHTCALTTAGGLKCWGSNGFGQLGDGTTTRRTTPTDVQGLTAGVAGVSLGRYHSCAVTTGGGVKCWGDNRYGQLGDDTKTNSHTPTDVVGLSSGVAAVTLGWGHTCALTTGGGLKCWGLNGQGRLGDGTTTLRTTPTDVSGLSSGVAMVAAGTSHTCAVTIGGAAKCWGYNTDAQLGDGTTDSRQVPTDVAGLASGVTAVTAGGSHSCAVANGAIACWGYNSRGQLGAAAIEPRFTPARTRGFGQTDFDSDDVTDVAVYRPSTGTWFSLDSSTDNGSYRSRGWGLQGQGDTPAPGDYDGDGIVDPTVYRPAHGTWLILESRAGFTTWRWFGWGNASDTPMPGDYDGDGATDAAIYRPSTGQWFVLPSSTDFGTGWAPVTFGTPGQGDVPVAGDFDGDGKRDPAVFRPSTGTWFWLKSSTSYAQYEWKGWGVQAQGDTPVPGDYDGDGKTDPCVYRPGTGTWFVLESHANFTTWSWVGWGLSGDTPVAGDYDGDGRTDAAVYRPGAWEWFVHPSGGTPPWNIVFGQAGDTPLVVR